MRLPWHSFLIPGVCLLGAGSIGIVVTGLTPLTVGALIAGLFLQITAVLRATAPAAPVAPGSEAPTNASAPEEVPRRARLPQPARRTWPGARDR